MKSKLQTHTNIKRGGLVACALIGPLLWAYMCWATTYYLDADASGANNGTSQLDAWETVADMVAGLDALNDDGAGDTVMVYSGSYGDLKGGGFGKTHTDWLKIIAAEGETPVFTGVYAGPAGGANAYVWLEGLKIQKDGDAPSLGATVFVKGGYAYIKDCEILGDGNPAGTFKESGGIEATEGILIWYNNHTVTGCTISSYDDSLYGGFYYGISLLSAENTTIEDTEIKNCKTGISVLSTGTTSNTTIDDFSIHHCCGDAMSLGGTLSNMTISDGEIYTMYPQITQTYESGPYTYTDSTGVIAGAEDEFAGGWGSNWQCARITRGGQYQLFGGDAEMARISSSTTSSITLLAGDKYGDDYDDITKIEVITNFHSDFIQFNGSASDHISNVTISRMLCYDCWDQAFFLQCGDMSDISIDNVLAYKVNNIAGWRLAAESYTLGLSIHSSCTEESNITVKNCILPRISGEGVYSTISGCMVEQWYLDYDDYDSDELVASVINDKYNFIGTTHLTYSSSYTSDETTTNYDDTDTYNALFSDSAGGDYHAVSSGADHVGTVPLALYGVSPDLDEDTRVGTTCAGCYNDYDQRYLFGSTK